MSISYSSTDITGRLGRDVEAKTGAGGTKYAFFSVATDRYQKKEDKAAGKEAETVWHEVTAFGQTAEFLGQYAKKGMWIRVMGEYVNDRFEDKAGVEHKTMKLLANRVQLIGNIEKTSTNTGATSGQASSKSQVPAGNTPDDEIPF